MSTEVTKTIEVSNEQAAALTQAMANVPTAGNFTLETSNYIKLEEGHTYDFVCNGLTDGTDFNDRDKEVENGAVSLIVNGLEMRNQDAALLGTVKQMIANGRTFPRLLRVYVEGKRQNAKGKEYQGMKIASADITPEMLNAVAR